MRAASSAARAESGACTRAAATCARASAKISRGQRSFAELAAVVRGHHRQFPLLFGRQFAPQVERRAPFTLLLVDPGQPLEHRGPVTRGAHQAAQLFLGAIHEARAQVVEAQRECGLLADLQAPCGGEFGVDGDGAIDFTALAHEAAERELDVRIVRLGGETREHFGRRGRSDR